MAGFERAAAALGTLAVRGSTFPEGNSTPATPRNYPAEFVAVQPSPPLVYAVFGLNSWHEDSPRTFCVSLPRPLPPHLPLLDAETGERVGETVKVWPTVNGNTSIRLRIDPRYASWAQDLRDDLLVHRRNIALDADGRLLVVGKVDTREILDAATLQRDTKWQSPPYIVV